MGENMKKFATFKIKLWQGVAFFICFISTVLIFIKPDEIKGGVRDGLLLCAEIIIPSLFPFTIISLFLFKSGIIQFLGKLISPITKQLFHLDENTIGIVFLSFISGYPVGARLINELYENKCISLKKAETMLYYSVNGGPAFIVIAIGCGLLNNEKLGFILLSAHILSAIIICFTVARFESKEESTPSNFKKEKVMSAFVNSVADSTSTMFAICSWVVIFSVINVIIDIFCKGIELNVFLSSIFEVTNGIKKLSTVGTVPAISFALGFAGFSVHMQVLSSFKTLRISMIPFLIFRAINGLLSAIICSIILHFFPIARQTFSSFNETAVASNSCSIPLFFALILTSVSFMMFYKSDRIK